MITICEGPDGGGKSRFAKYLRDEHLYRSIHHGPYLEASQIAEIYLASMKLNWDGKACVLDRSWISEPIYAYYQRGARCRVSTAQRRMLERVAWGRGAAVALFLPGLVVCRSRWAERRGLAGEYVEDELKFEAIYQAYQNLNLDLPVVRVTEVNPDYEELIEILEEARAPYNDGPGVGHVHPKAAVLVGDRPRPSGWGFPFCSDVGCSPWLAEQLEEAGVRESELYWCNVYDDCGAETNLNWFKERKFREIYALGQIAERALARHGVPHVPVHHPQWHKRFHHREDYDLITYLEDRPWR